MANTEKGPVRVLPGERIDDLQRNHLRIIQNPDKFCFGMDAVLLTGFAAGAGSDEKRGSQFRLSPWEGAKVLDLGTGTGIIPILLSAKTNASHFTGLEIQHESADMAERSVRMNGLEDRISIREGDIRQAETYFGAESFDAVTSNPPYMAGGRALTNPDSPMAIARHEICCTLSDVVSSASKLLRSGGRFYMVHRPERMAEIFENLRKYRLEPKRMQLVYPYVDREANMVLFECVKGGKPELCTEKPIIVYEKPGVYRREIYDKLAAFYGVDKNYLMTEDEEFVSEACAQYGERGRQQAEQLVAQLSGLFAGGELSENDRDAIMLALYKAYFECKEENRKYALSPHKKDDEA